MNTKFKVRAKSNQSHTLRFSNLSTKTGLRHALPNDPHLRHLMYSDEIAIAKRMHEFIKTNDVAMQWESDGVLSYYYFSKESDRHLFLLMFEEFEACD